MGQWYLDNADASQLREYLDRSGFLLVDDFWGEAKWSIFIDSMQRVFPDRSIVELPDDREIMQVHFDIVERTQYPAEIVHAREQRLTGAQFSMTSDEL